MNIHFTKLIKTSGRQREFNIRKLPHGTNSYHVDVSDDRGNRIIFRMQKDGGDWRIVEQDLPQWIYAIEGDLNNAIENESSNSSGDSFRNL